MGESRLVRVLVFLGFHCVHQLYEFFGEKGIHEIKTGTPLTWDYSPSGGMTVVYDEEGRPWIRIGHITRKVFGSNLKKGAYIPFAKDGGNFIKHTFPRLRILGAGSGPHVVRNPKTAVLLMMARAAKLGGDSDKAHTMFEIAMLIENPRREIDESELEIFI